MKWLNEFIRKQQSLKTNMQLNYKEINWIENYKKKTNKRFVSIRHCQTYDSDTKWVEWNCAVE